MSDSERKGFNKLGGEVFRAVFERFGGECAYCGAANSKYIDHIIPRSRLGTDHESNLALCCGRCNSRKGAAKLEEFRQRSHPGEKFHFEKKGIVLPEAPETDKFDISAAFDEINVLWAKITNRKQPKVLRLKYDLGAVAHYIKSQEDVDFVKNQMEIDYEDGVKNLKYTTLNRYLERILQSRRPVDIEETIEATDVAERDPKPELSHEEAFLAKLEPVQALYGPPPSTKEVEAAFSTIWAEWPKNLKWPEKPAKAWAAFKEVIRDVPLEDVVSTCMHYARKFNDPESGLTNPHHLATILGDEEKFAEWRTRASFAPKPEDVEAFDAAWAWYPDFPHKQRHREDSLYFYIRHIKPAERWRFFAAVKNFRDERRDCIDEDKQNTDDVIKFTKSFITFVGEWRDYKFRTRLASDFSLAFCDTMNEKKLLRSIGAHNFCNDARDAFIWVLEWRAGDDVRTAIQWALLGIGEHNSKIGNPTPELEPGPALDALVQEIYNRAWRRACKPPNDVLIFV